MRMIMTPLRYKVAYCNHFGQAMVLGCTFLQSSGMIVTRAHRRTVTLKTSVQNGVVNHDELKKGNCNGAQPNKE
jgi:hypothetical protein